MPALTPTSSLPPREEMLFEQIAVALEQQGYGVFPAALPNAVALSLVECLGHIDPEHFRQAGIGRGSDYMHNRFVRRDSIVWIEEKDPQTRVWRAWCERLQTYLNRRLFLGLFSFESHFALYEPGAFYRRHLDAFRGQSNRVVSLVTYLNRGWQPDQGGELVIYPGEGLEPLRVTPAFGTLVLFLSTEVPHEVLPARRARYSVAGWFRINEHASEPAASNL